MSAETVTLEIHREKPLSTTGFVLAKAACALHPTLWHRSAVHGDWGSFEWWAEIPAPVKPKRFVVGEYVASGVTYWRVTDTVDYFYPAYLIPTPEAAQRIADIYEETTP